MAAKDRITPSIHLENFDDPRHSNHTNFILTSPRSLRACHRFNIKPVQLLPRSIADFEATYGKNERAFEVFETNRKNILQLVRAERKKYMEDDSLVKPNAVQKDLQKKSLDRGFGCSGAKNSVQFTCTANRLNTEPGNHDQDNVEEVAHRFKRVSVGANGSIESSLKENHLRFPSEEAEGSDSSVDSLQEILAGHRKKESEWWPKVNVRTDGHGCRTSNESMESLSNSQSLESTHCDGAGAARFFSTSRSPVRPLAHTVCTTPRRAEIESLRSHLQHLSSSFLLHQRKCVLLCSCNRQSWEQILPQSVTCPYSEQGHWRYSVRSFVSALATGTVPLQATSTPHLRNRYTNRKNAVSTAGISPSFVVNVNVLKAVSNGRMLLVARKLPP
eukprot:m.337232 g.337232  ORF g.337232 m.337232 type:complete len:388 (+) comp20548_c0_seq2:202-1365(+)